MQNIDELFKRRHCDREIIFLIVVWVGIAGCAIIRGLSSGGL